MEIKVPEALRVLSEKAAHPVYIVGGFVRNQIKGLKPSDIDLCGPCVAQGLNLPREYVIKMVNYRLGTALIKCGKDEYEYTPFRIENYAAGGGHTPLSTSFTADMKQDVKRRDFTANSVYYDIKNNKIIDFVGGVSDINNGILKAANPEKTFSSDGLRLMRLVRIASETGFKIESATALAAQKYKHYLADISKERIRDELEKILVADTKYGVEFAHYRGLKLLVKLGLMDYIIPPLLDGDGLAQNPQYHKFDVLEHILQTVKYAPPEVRRAALFHDIAKPYCFKTFAKMHGHEKAGEIMTREIMGANGLKYSNAEINETARLVRNHMYDMNGLTSLNKVKMFIAKNSDIIDKLCALIKADRKGSGLREVPEVHRFELVKQQMTDEGAPLKVTDLNINGTDLLELGFSGEAIGIMLTELFEKCVLDPHLNNEEWLKSYASKKLQGAKNTDK